MPTPVDDPYQQEQNVSLTRWKLDREPSASLAEPLKRTIHYFDELFRDQAEQSAQ